MGGANKNGVQIRWASVADQMRYSWRGGNTSVVEKSGFGQIQNQIQWPLTNTVYLKARNEGGATYRGAFCGIQTK